MHRPLPFITGLVGSADNRLAIQQANDHFEMVVTRIIAGAEAGKLLSFKLSDVGPTGRLRLAERGYVSVINEPSKYRIVRWRTTGHDKRTQVVDLASATDRILRLKETAEACEVKRAVERELEERTGKNRGSIAETIAQHLANSGVDLSRYGHLVTIRSRGKNTRVVVERDLKCTITIWNVYPEDVIETLRSAAAIPVEGPA